MRRARLVLLLLSTAVFAAAPCGAQWQATFDAGLARLRQTGVIDSNTATFGANVQYAADRAALSATGLAAQTTADRWTIQGVIGGAIIGPTVPHARLELDGFVSTFAATNLLPTFTSELLVRARGGSSEHGGAIAIGGGTFSHETRTAPLLHAQANVWRVLGHETVFGDLSIVHTQSALFAASFGVPVPLYALSYSDISAAWRHDQSAFSIGATAGVRADIQGGEGTDNWASADATLWIAPRIGVVGGIGRTLRDIVHGVPRTRYASIAIRIAAQPHASLFDRRAEPSAPQLAIERVEGDRRRIEIRARDAARVEIIADFTGWAPVSLDRSGDRWTTERTMPPGLHRIAIRINGAEWIAPANLPRVTDDLGGVVGLITVP